MENEEHRPRMSVRSIAAAFAATSVLASCSFYMAEPRVARTDLRADLSGAAVVPATASGATGYLEGVYRPSTQVFEYRLNLVGLSGPVSGGALHGPAAPGGTAPAVSPINIPIYDYTVRDGATLTRDQAAELLAGRWYVSVSTLQYPGGEIRGQLLPVATKP